MSIIKKNLIGLDIGGTKCAIVYGCKVGEKLMIRGKKVIPTTTREKTIQNIIGNIDDIMKSGCLTSANTSAIGIVCGGPLNSEKGLIMSPPNLPDWNNIPVVDMLYERFGIPGCLQNDANACALAEWKLGAGRGTQNMIFLTFGTGMGAGLILNGTLYSGTNDNAGEVGHVRLSEFGPVGYGKVGSFEGFCSGSGIAQLAKAFILEKLQMGEKVNWCKDIPLEKITAKDVAEAAISGDCLAKDIYKYSSVKLGKGISILIDILNPEVVVIGGIYGRCKELMEPYVLKEIKKEVLFYSGRVCHVKQSELGENIGDYAALSVADDLLNLNGDE